MPIAAAGIIAAGTIGGALIGSSAAGHAADAQMQMQQQGLNFQRDTLNQQKEMIQPYNQFGQSAMGTLSGIYGWGSPTGPNNGAPGTPGGINWDAYINTPDYQFTLGQGVRALDMSAASKHLLNSGGEARAVTQYGQGLAGTQFGSTIQRLMSMVGVGQQAASSFGNNAAQMSSSIGQGYNAMGNTAAQGIMGQANPWVSALNNGPGNALAAYRYGSGPGGNTLASSMSSYAPVGAPMDLNQAAFNPMNSSMAIY